VHWLPINDVELWGLDAMLGPLFKHRVRSNTPLEGVRRWPGGWVKAREELGGAECKRH
jgi:hypothetical protein